MARHIYAQTSGAKGAEVKKLINRPEDVVREMTEGLLALYPELTRVPGHYVLQRWNVSAASNQQVALISGGGSGHEPAHAGFIGEGMLTAAVAGEVFTSPTTDSVLSAIRAVTGKKGTLLIVKNYTGDRLNFGLAAEMARSEGLAIEQVIVADDVALAQSEQTAGRRGLAGTVLVHKIAGAAAAEGKCLAEVKRLAQRVAQNIGTMSVSLSAGTPPSLGRPSFTLTEDEVELGLGIHGEPGIRRTELLPADALVEELLQPVLSALEIRSGERVAALINNLGTTTVMEQAIIARRTLLSLRSQGAILERLYAGTFMSSLDMAGVSISLLRVDDDLLAYLDAPTSAPAWPNVSRREPGRLDDHAIEAITVKAWGDTLAAQARAPTRLTRAILTCCDAVSVAENRLTELDRIAGDGDLGINMVRAADAIRHDLPSYAADPIGALRALAFTVQNSLGGSSGPLYSAFLLRLSTSLKNAEERNPRSWAAAALNACDAISELGDARLGDRTMLDALLPFSRTLNDKLHSGAPVQESLREAAEIAERSAEATAHLVARRGRASYLGERVLGHPDPGAVAVAILLRAVAASFAE